MIITLKEQAVIKEWDKRGMSGLRSSSLALLDNLGIGDGEIEDEKSVAEILIRHTVKMMPQGLWGEGPGKSKRCCEEICFLAGVDFDEAIYRQVLEEVAQDRVDEEFDDDFGEEY